METITKEKIANLLKEQNLIKNVFLIKVFKLLF